VAESLAAGGRKSVGTPSWPIEIRAPRVDDRWVNEVTGGMRFRSPILPPGPACCRSAAADAPQRDERGVTSCYHEGVFGSSAGLSLSVITRLTTEWQKERDQFVHRSLKDVDYVYVYADGIHFNFRLEDDLICKIPSSDLSRP
jgi:putative transposase